MKVAHVKAHAGEPGNDIANDAARSAVRDLVGWVPRPLRKVAHNIAKAAVRQDAHTALKQRVQFSGSFTAVNLRHCGSHLGPSPVLRERVSRPVQRSYSSLRLGLGLGRRSCNYARECAHCPPGTRASASHILFECPHYNRPRAMMRAEFLEAARSSEEGVGVSWGDVAVVQKRPQLVFSFLEQAGGEAAHSA